MLVKIGLNQRRLAFLLTWVLQLCRANLDSYDTSSTSTANRRYNTNWNGIDVQTIDLPLRSDSVEMNGWLSVSISSVEMAKQSISKWSELAIVYRIECFPRWLVTWHIITGQTTKTPRPLGGRYLIAACSILQRHLARNFETPWKPAPSFCLLTDKLSNCRKIRFFLFFSNENSHFGSFLVSLNQNSWS